MLNNKTHMLQTKRKSRELVYFQIHWCYHDNRSSPHCWSPTLQKNSRFNVPVSIFFLFPFRMCRAASLCGGDGADGTIRGCVRPTETLTSTEHQKQLWLLKVFFFLFLSFPTDWDRFVCKRSAWIPSQTSVVSCSMDTSRLHWGLQEAEIFHSSLLDAGFCCPICISYASTKLPKLESVC